MRPSVTLLVLLGACDAPAPVDPPVEGGDTGTPRTEADPPWWDPAERTSPAHHPGRAVFPDVGGLFEGDVFCDVWYNDETRADSGSYVTYVGPEFVEADELGRPRLPSLCHLSRLDDTFGSVVVGSIPCSDWEVSPAEPLPEGWVRHVYARTTETHRFEFTWFVRDDGGEHWVSALLETTDRVQPIYRQHACGGRFVWTAP